MWNTWIKIGIIVADQYRTGVDGADYIPELNNFDAECISGNCSQCGGCLECLCVALTARFLSVSDGTRPEQIILGQMGGGVGAHILIVVFVSGSTSCSSPAPSGRQWDILLQTDCFTAFWHQAVYLR